MPSLWLAQIDDQDEDELFIVFSETDEAPSFESVKYQYEIEHPRESLKPPRTHPAVDICEPPRRDQFYPCLSKLYHLDELKGDEFLSPAVMWERTMFRPIDSAPTNQRVLIYGADEMAMAWLDLGDRQWYYAPQGGLVQFEPVLWREVPQPKY